MTVNELYDLEGKVWNEIQVIREKRELETKAFVEGMTKGSDMMLKAVRNFIQKEEEEKLKEYKSNG